MIKCDLLKLSVLWNFHYKLVCKNSIIIFGPTKYDCVMKTREMFIFLPLINNLVTIGLNFLL